VTRPTPASRALIGCLALASDDATLNQAAKLAGYELKVASPVQFYRGRCRQYGEGARVVVRNGRIVRISGNAWTLTAWMLRLGRKLSALGYAVPRQARRAEGMVMS
jgi:hypothetical protein